MSTQNGAYTRAVAAALLRERPLSPDQEAAVGRLGSLYFKDKATLEVLTDDMTPADRRLVLTALRQPVYETAPTEPAPPVAPELLQRIAEAAAAREAERLVDAAKLDAVVLTRRAFRNARTPAAAQRAAADMQAAEADYAGAHAALERAQVRLMNLYGERDARARDALLARSIKE